MLQLLSVNGKLTAEVPLQDPATLGDVRERVEFTYEKGSGFWFPAVSRPAQAPSLPTKQWFQAGYGDAADFRVNVQFIP